MLVARATYKPKTFNSSWFVSDSICCVLIVLFIYLGFYVAFNTVQVISRRAVGRAEETSTYRSSGFCTVNCRPTASNYQLSNLRPCREPNPGLRVGRQECYHFATVAPIVCCVSIPSVSSVYESRNTYFRRSLSATRSDYVSSM